MRTGYNSEFKHGTTVYHVQTEDKGLSNPIIETLVYVGGRILDAMRSPYDGKLGGAEIDKLMEGQHRGTIQKIKSGAYEAALAGRSPDDTQGVQAPKGLDDLIINYLQSDAEKAHLEISISTGVEFIYGRRCAFEIIARNDRTRAPMPGVGVEVRLVSTVAPPALLFECQTGADGKAQADFLIPELEGGNAAVIIKGVSPLGSDELKQFVKRVKTA
jgi:hypothetical protein